MSTAASRGAGRDRGCDRDAARVLLRVGLELAPGVRSSPGQDSNRNLRPGWLRERDEDRHEGARRGRLAAVGGRWGRVARAEPRRYCCRSKYLW